MAAKPYGRWTTSNGVGSCDDCGERFIPGQRILVVDEDETFDETCAVFVDAEIE